MLIDSNPCDRLIATSVDASFLDGIASTIQGDMNNTCSRLDVGNALRVTIDKFGKCII